MKKRVNAELISIAHRILKIKDASDTIKLQQEAKNLYDQLTILRFYEENFENFKTEIPQEVLEEKLDPSIKTVFDAPIPVVAAINSVPEVDSQVVENEVDTNQLVEETAPIAIENEVVANELIENPAVSDEVIEDERIAVEEPRVIIAELVLEEDDLDEEEPLSDLFGSDTLKETIEVSKVASLPIEDLTAHDYSKMDFVKVEPVMKEQEVVHQTLFEAATPINLNSEEEKNASALENEVKATVEMVQKEERLTSLNDILNKIISFGLNDRIGFEKKLFNGNPNDFNRVVSQLNTFDSFEEAKSFVDSFVKPDYNNWEGCEEYEARFMEIVAKKFL